MSKIKQRILVLVFILIAGFIFLQLLSNRRNRDIVGTVTEIHQQRVTVLTDDYQQENGGQSQGDLVFTWERADEFQIGDRLKITIKGPVLTSFPEQATVTKIEKINEIKEK
ncbi:hypothetical protein GCM10011482_23100 [Enterococcus alcedinis]|uniref:DUF3221 domain-containing protein n=1 Tax=Enterococcus alcedinis TaxID=1274384 RepID=A0A917JJ69_9ENTE|nr:DUF3221 domain-containing protein [Enterococcus alcedinis]MBP2103094.1 hypothetical protein [Enterococcus alcedinis]GGI66656.1 hypothetical protein GCM10011482_23100 [Enterococcus alcedinis]